MKNYTYHREIRSLIAQFIHALDDCIVKRYDENDVVKEEISVRYVYAPKTRTLHWLTNKQQNMVLPVVSISIGNIVRDVQRVYNKIDGPIYVDEDAIPYQPVPINISVNVSLLSKYQNDMDQMVSNFLPYFDPYIVLSWKHPVINREIRADVHWSGSLAYNYPVEAPPNTNYRIGVDTNFTIKAWMFKKEKEGSVKQIYNIVNEFYGLETDKSLDIYYGDTLEHEDVIISGCPTVVTASDSIIHLSGDDLTIYGNYLDVDGVYISGSMLSGMEEYDLYSEEESLSGQYPPFYGQMISNYKCSSDNLIWFEVPALSETGYIDIIVANKAGYGKLTTDTKVDGLTNGIYVAP